MKREEENANVPSKAESRMNQLLCVLVESAEIRHYVPTLFCDRLNSWFSANDNHICRSDYSDSCLVYGMVSREAAK
jgi:hypothetical protein